MTRNVIISFQVEGFHKWTVAPDAFSYLRNKHRHIFEIKIAFLVNHNEREIEINAKRNEVLKFLYDSFGNPCQFDGMSCESIAEFLMLNFKNASYCEVLEDGYAGASFTR